MPAAAKPEGRQAPSPSTASTSSCCSSGCSGATPVEDAPLSHLCGPLSPPLRQNTPSYACPTPRSTAGTPTSVAGDAQPGSRRRLRAFPKLPRCLLLHKARSAPPRPASCQATAPRHVEEEGPRASCASVGSVGSTCSAFTSPLAKNRSFGTVLLHEPHHDLDLFRDEAEYSDYLTARLTGKHAEIEGVVYYEIEMHLSRMRWTVFRRFSEFRELRQQLLKHFGRRLRAASSHGGSCCAICENILESIEVTPFPSRRKDPPASFTYLLSVVAGGMRRTRSPPASAPTNFSDSFQGFGCQPCAGAPMSTTPWHSLSARHVIAVETRKGMLQDFVSDCLLTVRSLRQHFLVLPEVSAAACEISVALRMIEEFIGLSFTRYLNFLSERGVDVAP